MLSALAVVGWLLLTAIVVGYPLLAGRIRMGGPDSDPITRDGSPSTFWFAYGTSTTIWIAITAALAWFIVPRLPW